MRRVEQVVLIVSVLGLSWLGMQAMHEMGHVAGAMASGGQVTKVVLHPLTLSRTDVSPNPHPLFVVWAGPVLGLVGPLAVYLLARAARWRGAYLLRFFAGFCLIANGVYLGAGSIQGVADAGEMLRYGSSRWQLIVFGVVTVGLGLYLWNGLGAKFGFGEAKGTVSRAAAVASAAILVLIAGMEVLVGSR